MIADPRNPANGSLPACGPLGPGILSDARECIPKAFAGLCVSGDAQPRR